MCSFCKILKKWRQSWSFSFFFAQEYSESFAILQFPLGFKWFKQLILPSADDFTKKDQKTRSSSTDAVDNNLRLKNLYQD